MTNRHFSKTMVSIETMNMRHFCKKNNIGNNGNFDNGVCNDSIKQTMTSII